MAALKSALILGASGLVGQQLLQLLLSDPRYTRVTCLLRRPLAQRLYHDPQGKIQTIVADFTLLENYQGYFTVDHVYCCLGTTLKRAGSKSAFRKVDFEYVHAAAQLARAQRVEGFVWVSSVGANAHSRHFYLKVKGELENAIMRMPKLNHAAAVRPGVLIGDRKDDPRHLEALMVKILSVVQPLLIGSLRKYRPAHPLNVARQMIKHQRF